MNIKRPRLGSPGGSYVAEKSDSISIQLLGGHSHEGVSVTLDQVDGLSKLYGIDLKAEDNPLLLAGALRNVFRHANNDGLRLMAFLAKHGFLEEGVDPVRSMATALQQDYFRGCPDHWNEEEDDD